MGMTCTSCKSPFNDIAPIADDHHRISKKSFKLLFPLGKGGFGKVWKVLHKPTNIHYAMKEISKVKLYIKKSTSLINQELSTLKSIHNFFISNIHFAFQTEEHLYIVTDYFQGGDLRYHINTRYHKQFTQNEIQFILACILLAIVYLHKHRIVHRDIKPENLVFDSKGYLHLTDFGVSKRISNCHVGVIDKSGTIGYASPEAILGLRHSYTADYFSLGVVAYELLTGFRPFRGKSKHQIKEQLLTKTIHLKPIDITSCYYYEHSNSSNSSAVIICDLVNSLLQRKVSNRLGANGIEEIIYHPFFKEFNWNALFKQEMISPFQIRQGEYSCSSGKSSNSNNNSNRRDMFESNNQFYLDEYWDILNRIKKEKVFASFYYDSRINKGDKCSKSESSSSSHTTSLADEYECFANDNNNNIHNVKSIKRNSGVSALSTKCD